MKLDLRERDGVSLLVLDGQLAAGGELQFREAIDTLLGSGRGRILVDFTRVSFMDSAGIGELVASHRTVQRLGGVLKILKPSKKIQDSLSLTRLLPIFEVFEDEETAIASYASGGNSG
ncbi:MAG TPA: STAS domain-containing protein [Candidatus Polarisedimenticolaceae bacterium]|nr:STAS domain-containing protein [Candidatus Polarisedimenticolaceae bacterium]